MTLQTSQKLMPALLKALNLGDTALYTRVVLVFDCNGPMPLPVAYATKVLDADAVLKVVETLAGAQVVADPSVEVVELKPAG